MINLKTLTVTNIDGTSQEIEFSANLARVIYGQTQVLDEHLLATELFRTGLIKNTVENRDVVRKYTKFGFAVYVQQAVDKVLEETV